MSVHKKIAVAVAVFSALSFGVANAATLFLTSDVQQAAVGDTVNVNVRIASDQSVNAAQGTLYYPKDIFDVAAVSHTSSIFDIWLAPPTVNTTTGEIAFLGGSTNSFSGASLPVFTITFRARGTGKGDVGFKSAAVTAGDGTGANVLTSSAILSFAIGGSSGVGSSNATATQPVTVAVPKTPVPPPKQIVRIAAPATPTTTAPAAPILSVGLYPDPSGWYNAIGNFLVQWPLPADVTNVATALNQDPQFQPTVSEGLFDNKTFGAVTEGVWYLHVRFKNSVGWGSAAHYRIAIDTTPPFSFTAKSVEGPMTEISAPDLAFSTKDQPSGVAFYRILADGNAVGTTTDTSFTLPSLSFAAHNIVVQAVDYANNTTESRLSITVALPPFITIFGIKVTAGGFFGTIIAVIILGILIGWWLGRKAKSQRKNRAVIAGRDVMTAFGVIQKNIEKMLGYYNKGTLGESQSEDVKFLLQETKEQTDKMKRYVSENVEEIEQ